MSGRKAYISSSLSVDDTLIDCGHDLPIAPLLWPWLVPHFDDWGRSEGSTQTIKAKIFPLFELVTVADIEAAITLFVKHGLLLRYQSGGKIYLAVHPEKWFQDQTHIRASKRESDAESRYPRPQEHRDYWEKSGSENSNRDARACAQMRADARDSAQERDNARICTPSPSPSSLPPIHPSVGRGEETNDESSGGTSGAVAPLPRLGEGKVEDGGDTTQQNANSFSVKTSKQGSHRKSGKPPARIPFPEDFSLTEERRAEVLRICPGLDPEIFFEEFRDGATAKGCLYADWPAAWRTWLKNRAEWRRQATTSGERYGGGTPSGKGRYDGPPIETQTVPASQSRYRELTNKGREVK